ncbi:urease accessory protein UreD [Desulfosediminicola flagellatus]|uniref:urease accessory protein UreD n=1 Tax=Desulfosediminicola flagellatus TaxID=2569541 RepID=UPI0010ABD853|nr:urease accessory protein UreD [Desulfosediminicola flagellatus]
MTINVDIDRNCSPITAKKSGWSARLDLEISHRGEKSVVSHSRQKGPLTIQRPFYPENEVCHLYLLHPPAGIVGGDRLQLNITTEAKGAALITTPGATKFYRSNGALAEQYQHFTVKESSSLEWLPQETIYFPNAHARLNTTIHLEGNAGYIGWEIHCLGLPANQKDFEEGRAELRLSLFRDKQPILLEALKISAGKNRYQAAFLQNQPILGSLIATGADDQLIDLLRENLPPSQAGSWGVTLLEDIVVIRYLGGSTNEARALFIAAWRLLRPRTLGKAAVIPRIWAT